MERQKRRSREDINGELENLGSFFSDMGSETETVTVSHGPYAEQLPVAGESVGRIRTMYADRFDLDPLSQAVIDGREVDDNTIIEAGQLLVFIKRAGEKGFCVFDNTTFPIQAIRHLISPTSSAKII